MAKRQRLEDSPTVDWGTITCAKIPVSSQFDWEPSNLGCDDKDDSDVSLLNELFGPTMDKGAFLQHCFRSCAVHGVSPKEEPFNRFQSLIDNWLFGLDPRRIFEETSSESIFVWLQQPETKRIHSIEVNDVESAYQLFAAGHATYCRAPPELEQALVQTLLTETGLGYGDYDPTGQRATALGRGEVEVFVSSTAGHVTHWHYDFQENFTIQLSGVKRWTIQKGTVRHPLRACTPHYNAPEAVESQLLAARLGHSEFRFGTPETGTSALGAIETMELHPGDSFYFPAGMWHKIEVIEPGVSINVSLMATNYAALTCHALQQVLLHRDEWRECIQGTSQQHATNNFQSLLDALPEVVREFVTCYGANAILPPCIVNPRRTNTTYKLSEDPDDTDEGEPPEEEEEDVPIDVMLFAGDFAHMSLTARSLHCNVHRLVYNPLASMFNESQDILRPYALHDEMAASDSTIYILNVNFAGNEAHESLIRIRFRVESSLMEELLRIVKTLKGKLGDDVVARDEFVHLVDFLVHHGCLLWSKMAAA